MTPAAVAAADEISIAAPNVRRMLCACRLTKRQHRRRQHLQAGIVEHQQQRQHAQSRLAVRRQLLRCGHTGGVAAFPRPRTFAARFMPTASQQSASGSARLCLPNNFRISSPSFATSPVRRSTSIKPLQSVIVPSSVNISETPLSAEFSSADAAEGARFVSSASISDSVVRMKNTLPINTSPFRSNLARMLYSFCAYLYIVCAPNYGTFQAYLEIFFLKIARKIL